MDVGETQEFTSREPWRRWLARHHRRKAEIWLILYRKSSGKQTLSIAAAVEEALCYGWIDSSLKSLDSERFALRFSRRQKRSIWSVHNRARVLRLAGEGKLTAAGLASLPADLLAECEKLR